MRIRFICSIYFFVFNIALASSDVEFKKNWKLVRDNDVSIVWKARKGKGIFASISTVKRKSDINLYKNKSFFKELLAKKKKMLTFSGVSEWQVAKHKWVKGKNGEINLKFEGSYTDHQGTTVIYTEIHRFSKTKVTQILYTQPKSIKTDHALKGQIFKKYGVRL